MDKTVFMRMNLCFDRFDFCVEFRSFSPVSGSFYHSESALFWYYNFHGLLLLLCFLSRQFVCGQTVTAKHNLSRTHLNFGLCKMSLVSYNVTNLSKIKSLRMWRNYSLCCCVICMPHISVSRRIWSIDSFLFRALRHSKHWFLLHSGSVRIKFAFVLCSW